MYSGHTGERLLLRVEVRKGFPVTADANSDRSRHLHGFRKEFRTVETVQESRDLEVYVKGEQGPALILLHELPGLTRQTFELGDYFVKENFRVVLPLLFGRVGEFSMVRNTFQICLQRELRELCLGKDGAMIRIVRELARQELSLDHERGGMADGVAVVGMCFTGSMVLALLLKDDDRPSPVRAPVMAQPSSGYSARALDSVREGGIQGPVLALRFEKDWICSAKKLGRLEAAFSACPAEGEGLIVHELEGKGHSTLVYSYDASHRRRDLRSPSPELIDAREAVTGFIRSQLRPCVSDARSTDGP